MVAPRGGVWLLRGRGHAWLLLQGGHAWLLQGACMVAPRGGMHGCSGGHVWDMTRYRDMINERAVHILLECILVGYYDFDVQNGLGICILRVNL